MSFLAQEKQEYFLKAVSLIYWIVPKHCPTWTLYHVHALFWICHRYQAISFDPFCIYYYVNIATKTKTTVLKPHFKFINLSPLGDCSSQYCKLINNNRIINTTWINWLSSKYCNSLIYLLSHYKMGLGPLISLLNAVQSSCINQITSHSLALCLCIAN